MDRNAQAGFTLIELLVAMLVAGILIGVGVPSFSSAIQNSRIQSDKRELQMALLFARSEAVKSRDVLTICPRGTVANTCGTDWKSGWLVFIDRVIVDGETTAVVENAADILRTGDALSKNKIGTLGSFDRTGPGAARNFIRFTAGGLADWTNGTFIVCDSRGDSSAVALNIALTGDIRTARRNSSHIPVDAFGTPVDCDSFS